MNIFTIHPNGHHNSEKGAFINLRNLIKKYESLGGGVTALKGVDLQVQEGEFLVITGKSGSGKTTLVNMITALDRATSGEVWVAGEPIHKMSSEKACHWRGKTVGVVFQSFELLPTLTILQNVMLPMDFAHKYSPAEQKERALFFLEQVEIKEHAYKYPAGLSGGQQQRAAIARAIVNDPPIIIADEPTGSLDSVTAGSVLNIFKKLASGGKTVLIVTHDRDIARSASRAVTLRDGILIEERR